MTLRRVMIALLAVVVIAAPAAGTVSAQAKEMFIPSTVYRTGPYAPSGTPFANGLVGLPHDAQRARRRGQRRQARGRGVRDPVRHQAGRRVLRAAQGQERRGDGVQPAQHRHHLPAHPEGGGGQDRGALDGLRHDRGLRRPVVPVGVHLPDHLLEPGLLRHPLHRPAGGRARQAQGQEDRPHLPQQPLRQGSQPDARGARPQVRLRADPARGGPPGPGAEGHVAPGAAHQPGLGVHVGLGRDEPGGGEGGRRDQLPDGPLHRQLVVGERGRRDPGRRRGQGLQGRDVPRPGHQLQGARRHREVRLRPGQEHRARRTRSARPSTIAASSTRCT